MFQSVQLFSSFFSSVADNSSFNSKSLGLRIQKKVFGKFSSKAMAKQFIDDDFGKLLDTLNLILTKETNSKQSNKVVKNLIRITVKLALLHRNNQFNPEEIALGLKFRTKLRQTALTIISFYEVDFTYDQTYLVKVVGECGDMLHKLVERHLSAKSHERINAVILAFSNGELLDKVFTLDGEYYSYLDSISKGFHKVVDAEW